MATNSFLPFAAGSNANAETDAQFATDVGTNGSLATGFVAGIAQSKQVNKVLRQATVMAAAIAQFIVDKAGVDANDSQTSEAIYGNLITALETILAPIDSPAFTTQLSATYGPNNAYSCKYQTDGTAVWGYTNTSGTFIPLMGIGSTGPYALQPFTANANINAKFDYVGNGAVGVGGSISANGPANNNFQWTGNDTSGFNPIYSHTNGFFQAVGGIYSYSTSGACAFFGTSVTGPIVNFYGTGGVAGTISINSSGGVSFNTTSDYRLKTDVQPITAADAWARLSQLKPVSFVRTDAAVPQRITGHLAHEYGAAYGWGLTGAKDATTTNDRGETVIVPQQIDTSTDEPDLVVALLDALARIEKLEANAAPATKDS